MTQIYKAGQIVRNRKGDVVGLLDRENYEGSHPLVYYDGRSALPVTNEGRYSTLYESPLDIVELIKDVGEDMYKTFTKDMLKDGMRVVMRCGADYFFDAKSNILTRSDGGKIILSSYDEYLNRQPYCDYSYEIMEIYSLGTLIWKREKEESEDMKKLKELESTIAEAQKQAEALRKQMENK